MTVGVHFPPFVFSDLDNDFDVKWLIFLTNWCGGGDVWFVGKISHTYKHALWRLILSPTHHHPPPT